MKRREFLGALAALSTASWTPALAAPAAGLQFRPPPAPERCAGCLPPARRRRCWCTPCADSLLAGLGLADERWHCLRPRADAAMLGRLGGPRQHPAAGKARRNETDLIVDAGTVDATYLSTAERVWRPDRITYVLVDGRLAGQQPASCARPDGC